MNQCCDINYQNCNNLDVIQGSYEGGQTLWECTLDLLKYPKELEGIDVMDMGCGLGLLGIQALKLGAKSVCFQDYNKDTFEIAITPQLKLNQVESNTNFNFVFGDWSELNLPKVDAILASEVIYREEYYSKVEDFIFQNLRPTGYCLMINKSYYFGVGGSVAGFKNFLTKLKVVEEHTVNTKKGVKKIAAQFLNDEPFQTERMCGLTNFVYKLSTQNKTVINRQYTTIFSIFQDREREVKFQSELAKLQLAPKVLYSDKLQRVEEYWPYNQVSLSEIKLDYVQVARMLGSFHKLKDKDAFKNIFEQPSIKQWLHTPHLSDKIFDLIPENNKQLQNVFKYIFSDKIQKYILGLLEDPSLEALPLVIAHNDLNATNFLKDFRKMQYHLIDFEFAGLNYPGYELANFFQEMEWDYTYPEPPYFQIRDGWDEQLKFNFLTEYWRVFADSVEIPQTLMRQIEIGGILQNYFWMLIGFLSLQRKEEQGIDLELYIVKRAMNIYKLNL